VVNNGVLAVFRWRRVIHFLKEHGEASASLFGEMSNRKTKKIISD
jgi:hypothetical protein